MRIVSVSFSSSISRITPILLPLLWIACSGESNPPELVQGARVVKWMMAEKNLERSAYAYLLPNGTPRQFVSYLFSSIGSAEWPMEEESNEGISQEEAQAIRMPLLPKGVRFTHSKPNPSFGKQIVLKWDDARNVVIVEGYLDPTLPPDLTREFTLPKVVSTNPLAKIAAESNLEMGATYQAFK